MSESNAERSLATLMEWEHLPTPMREYPFAKGIGRRWRFDFAFPEHKVAVEVEGGAFVGGRHTRGAAFEADCEKYNEAVLLGWRVIRVTPRQVEDGRAVAWLRRVLG